MSSSRLTRFFFCERVSFMYFPAILRMIQLTFLFHDELNVRDRRVERNYRRFGYRFFTPKDCHWRSNWKKNMFNRWGHQKHNEKMWRLKKMLHCSELKRKTNNISHVFLVSFSKGSSNTLLRFTESQWGEKLFGLENCYQLNQTAFHLIDFLQIVTTCLKTPLKMIQRKHVICY